MRLRYDPRKRFKKALRIKCPLHFHPRHLLMLSAAVYDPLSGAPAGYRTYNLK